MSAPNQPPHQHGARAPPPPAPAQAQGVLTPLAQAPQIQVAANAALAQDPTWPLVPSDFGASSAFMSAVLPLPLPTAPFRMIPRPRVIGVFPSHEIHNGAPITLVIAQQAQFQRDLAAWTYPALPSPEQEIPRSITLLPFGVCPSDEDADEVLDDVFRVPGLHGWAEDEQGKIFMVKARAKGQWIPAATWQFIEMHMQMPLEFIPPMMQGQVAWPRGRS
jgi:hypothetical protein